MKVEISKANYLNGEIEISGSKNSCLPILAICLLTKKKMILTNVPNITDVNNMLIILKHLGVKVKREKDGIHIDITVKIHHTQNVSDTAFKIQESVRHNLESMTEYRAACVNVHISGVDFEDNDEKIEEKSENKTFTTENK